MAAAARACGIFTHCVPNGRSSKPIIGTFSISSPQRRLGPMSHAIGDGIEYSERHGPQPALARRTGMK